MITLIEACISLKYSYCSMSSLSSLCSLLCSNCMRLYSIAKYESYPTHNINMTLVFLLSAL